MNLEQAKRNFDADKSEQNAATLIRMCMRSGLISERNVRYCASLGDKVCSIIFPNEWKFVEEVLVNFDRRFSVEFAVWCSRKALHVFENKYPNDNRPRLAIEAAENWLKNPNKENEKNTERAAQFLTAAPSYSTFYYSANSTLWTAWTVFGHDYSSNAETVAYGAAQALENTTEKELLIEYLMKDIL